MVFDPALFASKVVLAPMVRSGTLPLRLMALRHGAHLVYTDEITDLKLLRCKRVENPRLGTVDFVEVNSSRPNPPVVLRVHSSERPRLVLQLGCSDPSDAARAAGLACAAGDFAAVDVNMGCPLEFSVHRGAGAALLADANRAASIVKGIAGAVNVPVSAKIRLVSREEMGKWDSPAVDGNGSGKKRALEQCDNNDDDDNDDNVDDDKDDKGDANGDDEPDRGGMGKRKWKRKMKRARAAESGGPMAQNGRKKAKGSKATSDAWVRDIGKGECPESMPEVEQATACLARMLEEAGASAITVHTRFREERPSVPAHWDVLRSIVGAVKIPVLLNGSIFRADDVPRAMARSGASGVMIARGALLDPTIFEQAAKRLEECTRGGGEPLAAANTIASTTSTTTPASPYSAATSCSPAAMDDRIYNPSAYLEYLNLCLRYSNPWAHTKYTLNLMLENDKKSRTKVTDARNWWEIAQIVGMSEESFAELSAYLEPENRKGLPKVGEKK